MLEVVSEDELVACDIVLGNEGEGYRVAVVGVLGGGEVWAGGGGAFGEAYDIVSSGITVDLVGVPR